MDLKDIKKALAGVCVATLLTGAGITLAGGASGSSSTSGTGGAEKKEAGKSG
jgi:radical SAM modification target selenobiotic family peptide